MKLKYKFLFMLILSILIISSCSEKNTETSKDLQISEISQISEVSDISEAAESSDEEKSRETQSSQEESSKDVSAEISEETSETAESSTDKESSEDENSFTDENSDSAYFFDDEQIVKDYHTAQTFTDDETFNESFKDNSIDKECSDKMKEAISETDMRTVIGEYTEKWKEQSQTAYEKLKELLGDNRSELDKLEKSQEEWLESIEEKRTEFYDTENIRQLGTMGLLSADTAMMNYYKGRAAVLYQQIFVLTGNMEDI